MYAGTGRHHLDGHPAGVGSSTGTFLKPGDVMRGTIERIGELVTPVDVEQ